MIPAASKGGGNNHHNIAIPVNNDFLKLKQEFKRTANLDFKMKSKNLEEHDPAQGYWPTRENGLVSIWFKENGLETVLVAHYW